MWASETIQGFGELQISEKFILYTGLFPQLDWCSQKDREGQGEDPENATSQFRPEGGGQQPPEEKHKAPPSSFRPVSLALVEEGH